MRCSIVSTAYTEIKLINNEFAVIGRRINRPSSIYYHPPLTRLLPKRGTSDITVGPPPFRTKGIAHG